MKGVQDDFSSQNIASIGWNLPGQVVLVLQGGGALGSYQAGAYQGAARSRHRAGLGHRHFDRRHQRQPHRRQ
jgi:hypothetical protein